MWKSSVADGCSAAMTGTVKERLRIALTIHNNSGLARAKTAPACAHGAGWAANNSRSPLAQAVRFAWATLKSEGRKKTRGFSYLPGLLFDLHQMLLGQFVYVNNPGQSTTNPYLLHDR